MKRHGFTLVEMLVAMALTLFIMVILSQAFITGLDTFSKLKGIGDMEETLRVARTNLTSDLAQDHFEGKRRLSDPTFAVGAYIPPRQGFLRVYQGTASKSEGTDIDDTSTSYGVDPSVSPPGVPNHLLHFTIKLRGNRRENFLSASVPPGSSLLTLNTNFFGQSADAQYQSAAGSLFYSQWGEVAYFLVQTGSTAEPTNAASTTGTRLYALYRAQFVVPPSNLAINNAKIAPSASYNNVACNSYTDSVSKNVLLYFYSPSDLAGQPAAPSTAPPSAGTTVAARTFDPTNPTLRGATLLTNNVVHFTVQVLTTAGGNFGDIGGTFPASYDTATTSPTMQILALQIIIRVWDPKTQQSRQITIVQDM